MKARTENILVVLKYLALLGGVGYSIECGSELLAFVASFISPEWARHVYHADLRMLDLRKLNSLFYISIMGSVIIVSALKAAVWYVVADLLLKLKLTSPFSIGVEKKLERTAYLLFGVWVVSVIGSIYIDAYSKASGIQLTGTVAPGEYLFMAGFAYIISQIFKLGIAIQEENQLTV